jgi:hypothetical protein
MKVGGRADERRKKGRVAGWKDGRFVGSNNEKGRVNW